MKDSNMKVKVGENRKMNCGLTAKIIRYNNANDIDVEFEDGYIAPNMKYSCFRQGEISNDPLDKGGRWIINKEINYG